MFCIFQGFPLTTSTEISSQTSCQTSNEGGKMELKNNTKSPILYFVKELVEKNARAGTHPETSNVFISQSYSPQIQTAREQLSCAQEGKFQSGVVYTCKVVIVSTSAVQMDLELQAEVPQGSIPVKVDNYFFAKPFTLSKYGNYTFEYSFYFPFEGQFSAFPPTLLANGEYLKSTDATNSKTILTVLKTLPRAEITAHECSLNDLVKQTLDSRGAIIVEDFTQLRKNILEQLEKANPFDSQTANLHSLVPVCAFDRSFFLEVVQVLRNRGIFNRIIWALSLLHDEEEILKEYLEYKFPRTKSISMKDFELYFFNNAILKIDGFTSKNYDPVVNSRAHFIEGRAHSINNKEFLDTYMFFLKYLQDKHEIEVPDKLLFAEYLIAQDRMKEACDILASIDQKHNGTTVQHDYLRVYCLMSQLEPSADAISEICSKYFHYPVVSWRNLFIEAANVLLEYKNVSPTEAKIPTEELEGSVAFRNAKNAQQRQTLKAAIEQRQIVIKSTNVATVTLNFYKVDVETKFSIDPFSRQTDSTFGFVSPNLTKTVEIKQEAANQAPGTELVSVVETIVDLPPELSAFNLCVQVSTGSKSLFLNYLPSSYQVVTLKERGILQVLNKKGQPVSQAYVKVFSCGHNGSEKYHKDGYTDYLGFFDYLSLNLENPSLVKEFSILILGPPNSPGSQILRVAHSVKDNSSNKGSRQQDLAVEDKLRTIQLELLAKLQVPQQSL